MGWIASTVGFLALGWLMNLLFEWQHKVAAKAREIELGALYERLDLMVEKRVRSVISELKWEIKKLNNERSDQNI